MARPRGVNIVDRTPYLLMGQTLFTHNTDGSFTNVGTIDGVEGSSRVDMSNDGTRITITTGDKGYQYNVETDSLTEITDADWVPVRHNRFFKGWTVFCGGNGQQFQVSAAYDSSDIDALDFASSEVLPDKLLTLEVCNELVYFFGTESVEAWQASGAQFPLEKVNGAFIDRGCRAENTVVKLDGQIFFLGDDLNIYRIVGYEHQGISPPGIVEKIQTARGSRTATAYGYIQGGHAFYVLNFDEFTIAYDITTQLWHERSTWNGTDHTRLKVTHVYAAYDRTYALHENGSVYELDPDYFKEDQDIIVRDRISEDVYRQKNVRKNRTKQGALEVDFQPGVGLVDNDTPYAMLRWSDDGGFSWSNEHWTSIGKMGQYGERAVWNRLGSFTQARRYWLRVSDPVKAVILDAQGDFT